MRAGRWRNSTRRPAVDGDGAVVQGDALDDRETLGVVRAHREGDGERASDVRFSISTTARSSLGDGIGAVHGVAARHPHERLDHGRRVDELLADRRVSCDGKCQRSSAPIHQSSDQPSNHGVTRPRWSTIASQLEPMLPIAVQLRPVTLVRTGRWPRGMKAGEPGRAGGAASTATPSRPRAGPRPGCGWRGRRCGRRSGSSSPGSSTSTVSPRRWNVERYRTMSSVMRNRPMSRRRRPGLQSHVTPRQRCVAKGDGAAARVATTAP